MCTIEPNLSAYVLSGITIGFQQPTYTVEEGSGSTPVGVRVVEGSVGELGFEPKVVLTLQSKLFRNTNLLWKLLYVVF